MAILRSSLVALLVLAFFGCAEESHLGKRPDASRTPLTVSQAIAPANLGRTVTIRGTVIKVCQEEGCWMEIGDGAAQLRMTFADEAFTVPMSLQGEVLVEGVVTEEIESGGRVPRLTATGVEMLK